LDSIAVVKVLVMELALMGGFVFCSAGAVLYTFSKDNHRYHQNRVS